MNIPQLKPCPLIEALESIIQEEPCFDGGGCFYPMHDGDGNFIGDNHVDPISVIQRMVQIAENAIDERNRQSSDSAERECGPSNPNSDYPATAYRDTEGWLFFDFNGNLIEGWPNGWPRIVNADFLMSKGVRVVPAPTPDSDDLPSVAGRMAMTHSDFQRACQVEIGMLQEKSCYDTGLVHLLCEAVRCSRECCDLAQSNLHAQPPNPPAETAHKCPVCNGAKTVSRSPGVAGDVQAWSASDTTHLCPACGATGLVWKSECGTVSDARFETVERAEFSIDWMLRELIALNPAGENHYRKVARACCCGTVAAEVATKPVKEAK